MIHITFLGTGTSQGIPIIACKCNVCNSTDQHDKRLRSSVYISVQGVDFVIDAGPDFRQQMLRNSVENIDAVLLTHEHKDHTAGLDDIRPYNFIKNKAIDIFAEQRVIDSVRKEFSYVFAKNAYPGVPLMEMHTITENAFEFRGVQIRPIRLMHWNLPILGYRIGNFAYISDASLIPTEEYIKLKNLDVLVINALRIEQHYSHFNLEQALGVIKTCNPRKAYLTHISHNLGFYNELENSLPPHIHLAYDGLQIQC